MYWKASLMDNIRFCECLNIQILRIIKFKLIWTIEKKEQFSNISYNFPTLFIENRQPFHSTKRFYSNIIIFIYRDRINRR